MGKVYPTIKVFENGREDKELTDLANEISKKCIDEFGLDYNDIHFHMVNQEELASVIAAHGWPQYPQSWKLGQEYTVQKKGHDLSNWRVYEIVVPSDVEGKEPAYAFLYKGNPSHITKLIIAHVYGHAHIFNNNFLELKFKPDSPLSLIQKYKEAVEEYSEKYGEQEVELMLEIGESLSTCIEFMPQMGFKKKKSRSTIEQILEPEEDLLKNLQNRGKRKDKKIPAKRDFDIFKFLIENADLEDWQREILNYEYDLKKFLRRNNFLNIISEGFASTINARYGGEILDMRFSENVDYLRTQCGTSEGILEENPYKLGFELIDYISRRGGARDYKESWEKILEVIATNTNFTFIDNYFTKEFYTEFLTSHGGENAIYQLPAFQIFQDLLKGMERTLADFGITREDVIKESGLESIKAILDILKRPGIVLVRHDKDLLTFLEENYNLVKNYLLFQQYNAGLPTIAVESGGSNYNDKGILYLVQDIKEPERLSNALDEAYDSLFDGGFVEYLKLKGILPKKLSFLSLHQDNMLRTLKGIYLLWKKPIYLKTYDPDNNEILVKYLGYDGKEHNVEFEEL